MESSCTKNLCTCLLPFRLLWHKCRCSKLKYKQKMHDTLQKALLWNLYFVFDALTKMNFPCTASRQTKTKRSALTEWINLWWHVCKYICHAHAIFMSTNNADTKQSASLQFSMLLFYIFYCTRIKSSSTYKALFPKSQFLGPNIYLAAFAFSILRIRGWLIRISGKGSREIMTHRRIHTTIE